MVNNDIGFVLLKLDNNPVYNNILDTIEQFITNRPLDQFVIFNSECSRTNNRNIPILHISHAKFFTGKLILFDIQSAIISKNFTNVSNRFLYTTNIPWAILTENRYVNWLEIYMHKNLELIVSDNILYDIYSILWKQPKGISEHFNYEQIKNFI